jgi:hypothetical protein
VLFVLFRTFVREILLSSPKDQQKLGARDWRAAHHADGMRLYPRWIYASDPSFEVEDEEAKVLRSASMLSG